TDITWDTKFRVASYTEDDEKYTYNYDVNGDPTKAQKVDGLGNLVSRATFSTNGLITDREAGQQSSHTDFNPDGTVSQFRDEAFVKTDYAYDGQGNITSIVRDSAGVLAVRFDYTYDLAFPGKVTSITPKDPTSLAVNRDWQAWRYDYYQAGSPAPGALFHA